jgi:hypothetical protein
MIELGHLIVSPRRAFYDDLPLCGGTQKIHRIFEYDPSRREVRGTSRASLDRSCASIRRMPLELRMTFDRDGSMYWTAGPYRDGTWTFILWDGLVVYDVPREAGFRASGLEHFNLRVRYASPAGWRTYSSRIAVDSHKGPLVFR